MSVRNEQKLPQQNIPGSELLLYVLHAALLQIVHDGLNREYFAAAVGCMLFVYLLYSGGQLLQNLLSAKLSQRIVRRMREELFGKMIDLPVGYLDTHSHGDVMSRMTNDIENISTTASQSLPSFFSGVLTIVGTAAMMLWYCWQLALFSCVTVFLTVLATKFLSGKVRKFSRNRQMLLGQLNGTVEEMISGYHTVVAYNHQDITTEDFCRTANSLTKAGIKTDIFSGVMGPVMNCIGNVGFVVIAAFGGYFSIHGMISVGVISAFIVYARQFSRPINEIAQIYGQLQTAPTRATFFPERSGCLKYWMKRMRIKEVWNLLKKKMLLSVFKMYNSHIRPVIRLSVILR